MRDLRAMVRRAAGLSMLLAATACSATAAGRPPSTVAAASARAEAVYYPPAGDGWERRDPAQLGFRADALAAAVAYAQAHETPWPHDIARAIRESGLGAGPYGEILGPVRDRGGPAGLVIRHGYIAAEWGDTRRPDITFSIAKSFLGTLAGVALDRRLIRSVDDSVRAYVHDGGFDSPHDAPITWRMLLNQTSEWEGTLWDKPDVADRREGHDRTLRAPGTFWEYNDVRVNRTALSLLRVWHRPLPQVLHERVMDPIGASRGWEWYGYRNSFVLVDGRRVQSVSGGSHWGGGMFISARDQARFGLLYLRRGRWAGRHLLSEDWVRAATTPAAIKPTYGYLWWLNSDRKLYPSAPASSFFALGAGSNVIWVDPDHDLVAVIRWIDNKEIDAFIARVMAAVE
ncbi:MAG TPA: serine hydrolase [Longimicrobiaceae bacterium]|nr:serine hydrolase [Longimicrobiaceae bacterium]